jgi:hypothetical protein
MEKRDWGSVTTKILRMFAEHGEMTRKEVCDAIGLDRMYISSILTRLNKAGKTLPKRIHVVRYVYDEEGARRYPRAVYALGDLPDAKKPKSDPKENQKRYREGLRRRMTGNSVFNLGLTRRQYTEIYRKAA